MKKNFTLFRALCCLFLLWSLSFVAVAQQVSPMRRPISPEQPMWLIHIDTWNNADPQKIIDMVPADIRPYVVFNISISINHNATDGFLQAEYGYEVAKSWVRTCAENRVWVMVQQASGGIHHFPEYAQDSDMSVWEEFYRDYPNFIGFNFAEQFWGFDDAADPYSAAWVDRITTFTKLMEMSHKYGGYLLMSWCGAYYGAGINPVAIFDRNPGFAAICKQYPENFILCEKFTSKYGFYDIESTSLGAYLSGFSGQYGIRFDETGWTGLDGESDGDADDQFPVAAGTAPVLEHVMLTGQTVIDGPELIMSQCSREIGTGQTADGYTTRRWEFYPQFYNISMDIFRKVLDGTVRILNRQEVIDRTKVVVVNDVTSGSDQDKYSAPTSLFDGLYRMDTNTDPNLLLWNRTWFKKSGRYPAIPTVFELADDKANSFSLKLNKSQYSTKWPSLTDKVNELNALFPQEYTGDIYAARHENGWVTYNPLKTGANATGNIPFKYNTCEHMELNYAPYTTAVIKEYSDKLTFYLTNYDNESSTLKTDVIKIYGSTSKPGFSFVDRANHQASSITENWTGGVYTLTVHHNGALDITVNCAGSATGRLTSFTEASVHEPAIPPLYTGQQQYEAEHFEFKGIGGNVTNGVSGGVRNYSGLGYLRFGTGATASIREHIIVPRAGKYKVILKYSSPTGTVNSIDLYANGVKVVTPQFLQTASADDWSTVAQVMTLNAGENTVMLSANQAGANDIYFDNILVSAESDIKKYDFTNDTPGSSATDPAAGLVSVREGSAGVISMTGSDNVTSNVFKAYSSGLVNQTGIANLDLFPAADNYRVEWKEYYGTAGAKKGVLLRGASDNAPCPFANGMQQGYLFTSVNNNDGTVTLTPFIAGATGIIPQVSYTSTFTINANEPCYYRATALGNKLKFECSKDSLVWEGGTVAAFTDNLYSKGYTQLVWGLGVDNFSWSMDNITFTSPSLSISKPELIGFQYIEGKGPAVAQSLVVKGQSLQENVVITAPDNYEISLTEASGYTNSLTIVRVADSIPSTQVYVRLKSGLTEATYKGKLSLSTFGETQTIPLTGLVKEVRLYDFEADVASGAASTPPAANVSAGTGNTATAGVVSYTNANSQTSNYFKGYSGGNRNATAAFNLDMFPNNAKDYSVTWKQVFGSTEQDYKIGVLLRGSAPEGDATTGYVEGLKQGYLFIAYNEKQTRTQFRIYKATSDFNSLSQLTNVYVDGLQVNPGQTVWYRATVSGTSPVNLKFEYSTDSLTWNSPATTTDNASSYTSGSTQLVWGLATATYDFVLDNITYVPVNSNPVITLSATTLSGMTYLKGSGPSANQSFNISGTSLAHNLVLAAPSDFELSLDGTAFSSSIVLAQTSGSLASTTVYTRLKAGLDKNLYQESISFSYQDINSVLDESVSLNGEVTQPTLSVATSSSLHDIGYLSGYPSIAKKLLVSGNTLTSDVAITVDADFEVSTQMTSGYQPSLTLTPTDGTLESTAVYVRLKEGQDINTYNGELIFSSTGAASTTFDLKGEVKAGGEISLSETTLNGFDYNFYGSPVVPVKSFTVWGNPVAEDITVTAPANYEVSLNMTSGFGSSLLLAEKDGIVDPVVIYVRLKSNLFEGNYNESITLQSGMAIESLEVSGFVSWSRIYDFTGDVVNTIAPALNTTIAEGNTATIGVVSYTNANNQTSKVLRAYSGGNRNATGAVNLNLFPDNASDYSVTWKQEVGSDIDYKVGMLLRGNGPVGTASTGYVEGIKQGYLFLAYRNSGSAKTEFRIYTSTAATGLNTLINNSVVTLFPAVGETVWYRATVSGTAPVDLKFEYSIDAGQNWSTAATTTHSSEPVYTTGSTQIVWGLGTTGVDFYLDDITFYSDVISPVVATSFNAQRVENTVLLEWDMLSEINTAGFEIERSTDGEVFETIGSLEGRGIANNAKHYSFTDDSPLIGHNYYRLKQIDTDENFTYSEIKLINIDPVVATSFSAQRSGNTVLLGWDMLSEINTAGFEIERSTDGEVFETIGSLEGRGTSSESKHYSFTDTSPLEGHNYYRLKQIDTDENFTYSEIKLINIDPVVATSFSAQRSGNTVLLGWDMLSEINTAGFEIERSTDGEVFETIGSLEGRGTSSESKHYSFTDTSPLEGSNYYRLKQIDTDESFTYSEIKVINIDPEGGLNVYPNPANDVINIKSIKEDGTFVIFDAMGKILLKAVVNKATVAQIDISMLAAGVYFYRLNSEEGMIIKQ